MNMNMKTLPFSPGGSVHRWKVLWAGFVAYLFDSYDLMVLAIAMPVLLKVLDISLPDGGLLGSATGLGAMLGSIVFGLIAENRGRRFSLILALVWLGVGMGAVYLVDTWSSWMILRFFTGLAIAGMAAGESGSLGVAAINNNTAALRRVNGDGTRPGKGCQKFIGVGHSKGASTVDAMPAGFAPRGHGANRKGNHGIIKQGQNPA